MEVDVGDALAFFHGGDAGAAKFDVVAEDAALLSGDEFPGGTGGNKKVVPIGVDVEDFLSGRRGGFLLFGRWGGSLRMMKRFQMTAEENQLLCEQIVAFVEPAVFGPEIADDELEFFDPK